MKYILLLSGDFIDLGKEEVLSLFNIKGYEDGGRLFIINLENESELRESLVKRLALTKSMYALLFECNASNLTDLMKKFDWNSVYRENFCLRISDFNDNNNDAITNKSVTKQNNKKISKNRITNKFSEKYLAKYIWRSIKCPKVNLENPKTKIELFFYSGKVYCGLLVYENKENFEKRKAHLRPFPHPSSLQPKVARALVNISEIKKPEVLFDPFCGTGGFLIEAGLMNIRTIGYDINKIMAKGCKVNLKYFGIKNFKIKNKNAIDINDRFDHVVTDFPYGLNSNAMASYEKDWKKFRINKKIKTKNFTKNLEKFYLLFLKNLRKKLKKKAVIIFPSYVNHRLLLKKSKLNVEKEFSIYVHRSLTRKIVKIY